GWATPPRTGGTCAGREPSEHPRWAVTKGGAGSARPRSRRGGSPALLPLEACGMRRARRQPPEGGTAMTECPECGRAIEPKDFIEGEIFPCPDCGLELEVTGLEPFRVDAAPREAEDWGE